MKSILILLVMIMSACGGTDYQEPEDSYLFDMEVCEDQGGNPNLFHVTNIDSDESFIEVQCEFEECEPIICKTGADCPVAECRK
jgi:hypothetical protein